MTGGIWTWIMSAMGISSFFLMRAKSPWAWVVVGIKDTIGAIYFIVSKQYGLLPVVLFYIPCSINAFFHWRKQDQKAKAADLNA